MIWAKPVGGQLSWHAFLARQIWLSFFSPSRTPPPSTAAAVAAVPPPPLCCRAAVCQSCTCLPSVRMKRKSPLHRQGSDILHPHIISIPHHTWRYGVNLIYMYYYSWSRITNRVQCSIIQSRVQNWCSVGGSFRPRSFHVSQTGNLFYDFCPLCFPALNISQEIDSRKQVHLTH